MSFGTGMKTIVVATDLNGQPEAALEYARKMAGMYGARIVLARGLDPVDYAAVGSVPYRVQQGLGKPARAALKDLAGDLLREGLPSHTETRQSEVAQMLAGVARRFEAGLMVIGTEGVGGAGPVIVGTVAEQLARLSPCPVLAVSEDWNAGEFRPVAGGPVMLAVERNAATPAAVEAACSLAEMFHRTLLVLHACKPDDTTFLLDPVAKALEDFGVKASGRFPIRFLLKNGSPAEVIAEAIERYSPSILVAGVKRTSDTPGPHGTAFALLAGSRVPVLCVPPEPMAAALKPEDCTPPEYVSEMFSRLERFAGFEVSTLRPGVSQFRSTGRTSRAPAAVGR